MKGIHTLKRDQSTQVISCRPWTSLLHKSLVRNMKIYLDLKDQVSNPPHTSPNYPERPNTQQLQKTQPARIKITRGSKKRSRDHQYNGRQYKVKLIEKNIVLPRALVILMLTTVVSTVTNTPPTISNPMIAITPWPSTSSASVNLFVTRSWSMSHNEGNTPMSAPEEMQKVRALDLSKYKIPPAREITPFHPEPSVTQNSAMDKIMAAMNTPSPAKRCYRWRPLCLFCVQSAHTPPQWNQTGQRRTGMVRYKRRRRDKEKRKKRSKDKKRKRKFWIQATTHQNLSMYPTMRNNSLHW